VHRLGRSKKNLDRSVSTARRTFHQILTRALRRSPTTRANGCNGSGSGVRRQARPSLSFNSMPWPLPCLRTVHGQFTLLTVQGVFGPCKLAANRANATAPTTGEINLVEKIVIDARQRATLVDGDRSVNCLTLLEAVVVRDNLPGSRKRAAKISCGGRVFTASEIDRLHFSKTV